MSCARQSSRSNHRLHTPRPAHREWALLVLLLCLAPGLTAAQDCRIGTDPRVPLFNWLSPADPWDIAINPDSTVYVTDPAHDLVCRYDLLGEPLGCWGGTGSEPGQFSDPTYLAVGAGGRVYVSDDRLPIQVFDASGSFLFQIGDYPYDATPGNFAGDTGPIAVDAAGNLYVSERAADPTDAGFLNRIQKFDSGGNFLSVFAQCTEFPEPTTAGSWFQCWDIEIAADGSLFLLDDGYGTQYGNRLSRFSPSGYCEAFWGVNGDQPGQLAYPTRIAENREGHLFVTDWFRIQEFDRDGVFLGQLEKPTNYWFNGIDFFGDPGEFCFASIGQGSPVPGSVHVFGPEPLALNLLDTAWLDENYELPCSDPAALTICQDGNRLMRGATADGVSPLLLRVDLPMAGSVEISLTDPNWGDTEGLGTLSAPCAPAESGPITVTSELLDGRHIAFAVYTGPENFDRATIPSDIEFGQRDLEVAYEFYPQQDQVGGDVRQELEIHRPPTIFVHGLWSEAETWNSFKAAYGKYPRTKFIDYKDSHGRALIYNWPRVRSQIVNHLSKFGRDEGLATAQADIIAHSMGGLLTRKIFEDNRYVSAANRGAGLYNKVLFMNVPHQGSPLANAVVGLRNIIADGNPIERMSAISLLLPVKLKQKTGFDDILDVAVDDLSVGSPELAFQPMVVPVHAHVGIGGSDLTEEVASAMSPFAALHYLLKRRTSLPSMSQFESIQHDFVVGRGSQEGGIYGIDPITLGRYSAGIHSNATKTSATGDLVADFIHTSSTDYDFFASGIPGFSPMPLPTALPAALPAATLTGLVPAFAGDVVHLSASPGTVSPGQTVTCSLQPLGDQVIQEAYVIHAEGMVVLGSPPFEGTFEVPTTAIGKYPVTGLALLTDGTLARSERYELTVNLGSAYVDSITVQPTGIHFSNVGSLSALQVLGHFSDGEVRDIATSDYWLNYYTGDSGVAEVDDFGMVQAMGPGETELVVRFHEPDHYQIDVRVPVTVDDGPAVNNPPHAVAGGPYTFCGNREICLDATGSFDYDTTLGDNLIYTWDLNGDGLFDDAAGSTPCVVFPAAAVPNLIGLRVRDSAGLTSDAYAELTPESPDCQDAVFVCQAGDGSALYDAFYRAEEVAETPDGGFFVLNYPTFYQNDPKIHKFDADCAFEFTIVPESPPHRFATDSGGILHIRSGYDYNELIRYSPSGALLPSVHLEPLDSSMMSATVEFDDAGNIYGLHGDWEGAPFGRMDMYVDRFDPTGQFQGSVNLDQVIGAEDSEFFCVTPQGDFYVSLDHQVAYVHQDNGQYVLGALWGEEGDEAGQFGWIIDLAVGANNDVFVAENGRVQRFSGSGEFLGQWTGAGGPDPYNSFSGFKALAIGGNGTLFAAMSFPNSVQAFRVDAEVSPVWEDPDSGAPAFTGGPSLVLFASGRWASNGRQHIRFATDVALTDARLRIFDLRGRLVRDLNIGSVETGRHEVVWDTRAHNGAPMGSGVYLLRLEGGGQVATGKTVIVR